MKIAYIICTFPPYRGGMGNSAFHFARVSASLGHEVTIFTPLYAKAAMSTPDLNDNLSTAVENLKIVRLRPLISFGNAAVLPQLLWRLKGFDLVHLHYPFYGSAEVVWLRKLFDRKMKLLTHYHMDNIGRGFKGLIFRLSRIFILSSIIRQSRFVTCASLDYIKNSSIADHYELHKTKFKQVTFGVDPDRFRPDGSKVAGNDRRLLFVASLDKAHYFKGLPILLNALKLLKNDDTMRRAALNLSLSIVGDGDMKSYYRKLVSSMQLDEAVSFLGGVSDSDLARIYSQADIFVLPSVNKGEAFGLVLLEAMASGLPVVASNLAGVRNVFRNEIDGLLCRPGNARDLAYKLKTLLLDDDLRSRMASAGRELVEKKYSWTHIAGELDGLYCRAAYTPENAS